MATDSSNNTKRTPKVQSDLAANSTLTLNENEPGLRSGQGHKFRNKVLPLYGDMDSLLPPRTFPDVPLNVTPQTTSTSSQGYRTSEMTDNLKNEAKTATTTKGLERYAASINSDYIVTGDRGDNEDEVIHGNTWCLKYDHDEEEMRNMTNSNSNNRMEREYSTISDFTSLTDMTRW